MTLEEEVERGQRAARILEDPLYLESWDVVAKAIHEQWEAAPLRDREGAHELKLMLKLLGDVRAHLDRVIADGKVAVLELERRRKPTLADFRHRYGN